MSVQLATSGRAAEQLAQETGDFSLARARIEQLGFVWRTMVRVLIPTDDPTWGGDQWRAQPLARRFLHEGGDPGLFGGGQLLQREGGRPHGTFV
jgi:hypothetical protein